MLKIQSIPNRLSDFFADVPAHKANITLQDLVVIMLSNESNQVSRYLPQVLARTAAPGPGGWDIPQQ